MMLLGLRLRLPLQVNYDNWIVLSLPYNNFIFSSLASLKCSMPITFLLPVLEIHIWVRRNSTVSVSPFGSFTCFGVEQQDPKSWGLLLDFG